MIWLLLLFTTVTEGSPMAVQVLFNATNGPAILYNAPYNSAWWLNVTDDTAFLVDLKLHGEWLALVEVFLDDYEYLPMSECPYCPDPLQQLQDVLAYGGNIVSPKVTMWRDDLLFGNSNFSPTCAVNRPYCFLLPFRQLRVATSIAARYCAKF
jgi:hypothetical protein